MAYKLIPSKLKIAFRKTFKEHYGFKEYEESYEDYRRQHSARRRAIEEDIPKTDLAQKHIINLQVLLNRIELLNRMPENAVCAEIGVDKGSFSEQILKITHPQKLHLIDAWGDPQRYHDKLRIEIMHKFEPEIYKGIVEVNVGYSTDVLQSFPDFYFDWIYLDTNHTYKTTAEELKILERKVKKNGIIAGHDYIIGNWVSDCRYGVIEAVHEFCVDKGWELLYLTINKDEMPSFAIRAIS